MSKAKYSTARPLNVNVLPGSPVAKMCRSYAGLPGQAHEGRVGGRHLAGKPPRGMDVVRSAVPVDQSLQRPQVQMGALS